MKKLKPKQRGPWCSFCEPKTTRAVYREDGFAKVFSCESHKQALSTHEKELARMENRFTEADEKSWKHL